MIFSLIYFICIWIEKTLIQTIRNMLNIDAIPLLMHDLWVLLRHCAPLIHKDPFFFFSTVLTALFPLLNTSVIFDTRNITLKDSFHIVCCKCVLV